MTMMVTLKPLEVGDKVVWNAVVMRVMETYEGVVPAVRLRDTSGKEWFAKDELITSVKGHDGIYHGRSTQ